MNNKKPITIGILAGMGPKSTSSFIDLVIEQCQKQYGARDDIDFPPIIIYSLPTPFYINQKIDDQKMETIIKKGLKKLESTGVDFIAMPCNTAHKYFNNLKKCLKIPLLNIIESTVKKISRRAKKVALLATRATVDANIYQEGVKKQNIKLILKKEWQKEIDVLIQGVKKGEKQQRLLTIIKKLSKLLRAEKIDTVIIACTDISKITKTMRDFTLIDSSEALAEETVKKYLS